ncbi:MAG: DUF4352 domain-containing protein [Roseburia sp.]|nr:DUF4352 domain-containing protein [Roseburia sp.]
MQEIINELDAGDYISLGACLVSVIAAIASIVACVIAKKQLELQEKQYEDGEPNFNIKVLDAIIKKDKKISTVQVWLNIRVGNISDKATSINNIALRLFCLEDIIYRPSLNKDVQTDTGITYFSIAQNIGAHSSEMGWCIFDIPIDTYNDLQIEYSELNVEDIHGQKCVEKIIYIQEELIDYGI